MIVGGSCVTVSLGGYLTGGGYGALTPWLGLAVDQILEVEVVLSNGNTVVAIFCQNQDLFWAIRGVGTHFFHLQICSRSRILESLSIGWWEYLWGSDICDGQNFSFSELC